MSPKRDGETPEGVTPNAGSGAKQSQSPPVDGVHGTPYEGGNASLGEETPDGVTTSAGECAKQSQTARGHHEPWAGEERTVVPLAVSASLRET